MTKKVKKKHRIIARKIRVIGALFKKWAEMTNPFGMHELLELMNSCGV
jgi:hypothetical protein